MQSLSTIYRICNLMENTNALSAAAEIVTAYASRNAMSVAELTKAIVDVYSVIKNVDANGVGAAQTANSSPLVPAVSIRKSVTPDYIVCLEDGKKLKILRRHLRTTYNMTPDEYRAKWGLKADYPMTAPNYSARRSEFAKQIGLGVHARGLTA